MPPQTEVDGTQSQTFPVDFTAFTPSLQGGPWLLSAYVLPGREVSMSLRLLFHH